jgi:hypothetical protein
MQQEHSGNDELDDLVRQGVLLLLQLAMAGLEGLAAKRQTSPARAGLVESAKPKTTVRRPNVRVARVERESGICSVGRRRR